MERDRISLKATYLYCIISPSVAILSILSSCTIPRINPAGQITIDPSIRPRLGSSYFQPPHFLPPPSTRSPRPSHRRHDLHAISGSAHIIGHSLGAHVAIRLAYNDPDVVNSVFISGFEIFPQSSIAPYIAYAACGMPRVENCLPPVDQLGNGWCIYPLHQYQCLHARVMWGNCIVGDPNSGHRHSVRAFSSLHQGKGGWRWRELNAETVPYPNLSMRHPWNCRVSPVFAAATEVWFGWKVSPEELVKP
ncbi:Alpha/beta hydrolase fold-1 [Penicillium cf. griseofulvum]|uniref:Alpha/beta hydrolase fold-1 n=1 Tax=Penicillium cf. griseofulvum TaxID=2972120 RepID=A0A9W9M227_9EURO|nr:Alpha/beta hydrolase fold-1 [Penicillium cf. griseofulvum]KAJ5429347.1 Alpha/beta hydrolase fold-1 [Penicillium cf. griseofulvum]